MSSWFPRGLPFAYACSIIVVVIATGAAKPASPKPSSEAIQARKIAEFTPQFQQYIFSDETFPSLAKIPEDQPARSDAVKITFYDRDYRLCEKAERAGPYGAVVEFTAGGRKSRRFITLYRTAEELAANAAFDASAPDELAPALGLAPAALRRQVSLVRRYLGKRTFFGWARHPLYARLLAGLSQDSAKADEPVHQYDNAFALERQWWVGLKRRLYGWDKQFPRPVDAPRLRAGQLAPVVREGMLREAGMTADAVDKIDKLYQKLAAESEDGFAVCIVRHGVIVLHKGYGTRDGKPMTVNTPSWMASVTKMLSASLMVMLLDRGLVKLNDPLDKFFPPLHGLKIARPITIHHLYTHTNGLTLNNWWPEWYNEPIDLEERLAAYYPHVLTGKGYHYNGTGNSVGSKIVEAVSGEALPQFYHRHLLEPLGCEHTYVTGSSGDAYSVPLDMAKVGQMLLNGGSYGKWEFFRKQTFQLMRPHPLTRLGGGARWQGLGLFGNSIQFMHLGSSGAGVYVDSSADLVTVMMRNRPAKNQDKYNARLRQLILAGMIGP
ncbi:MAG TPA: serine hydrolase [Gemmataceae bacterium]|nr:serine hydrolase [Gemmataceae bacterium]